MSSVDIIQSVASWALRLEHNKVLSFSGNIANANSATPKLYGQNLGGVLEHMKATLERGNENDIVSEAAENIELESRDFTGPIALDQQISSMLDAEARYKSLVEIINRKSALRNAVMLTQR